MNTDRQERIRGVLIRRALEEESLRNHRREENLHLQDTLVALEEITTLTREELEILAGEMTKGYDRREDTFFSIKHQVLLAGAFVGLICCIPLLGVWLF